VPRKSGPFDKLMVLSKVEGHTRNADLTIMQHGGRCPDLSGPAGALRRGPPWRDTTGTLSCLVEITVSVAITNPLKARGLGQVHEKKKDTSIPIHQ
jgi:hypothetical protein